MVTTRRNAASADASQSAQQQNLQRQPSAPAPPKRKGRRGKAAATRVESRAESQPATTVKAAPRSPCADVAANTVAVSKRLTRAERAAGAGSPFRSYEQPKRQAEKKRKRTNGQTASATPESEPAQPASAQNENDEEPGMFFSEKFDQDIMHVEESSPMAPFFVNSSESAIALLRKIENAAKEPIHVDASFHEEGESKITRESDAFKVPSPGQLTSNTSTPRPTTPTPAHTPDRAIASPSGFFSRSFSALKSKLGLGTPTPHFPQNSQNPPVSSAVKPLPPSDTFTETLSLPPTPIGERTITSSKKKKKTNTMLKTLLKGVEPKDKSKAEEWAKNILPRLKNDPSFREKRRRLETPVLVQDLDNFPSSKPWETGFGDPLGDLDEGDVVPVWAVYLDIVAEEEEHMTKKHKVVHDFETNNGNVLSINEQYAASNGANSALKVYNSHGHSTSLLDLHPRRSIDPSPMFDIHVSHHQGANVFSELQGYDTTAKQRAKAREYLKTPAKGFGYSHNPNMGSFSVPDESDEEDSNLDIETSDANGAPLWTQPPPPPPVPAHAPLPGGSVADAPSIPAIQQPVDEVERQRQKLMKHTPAKPSRLREATYPSPSLLSDAGTEFMSTPTPAYLAASMASIFADMPTVDLIELDDEEQAALDALVNSEEYQQQMIHNPWPEPIATYGSDEDDVSPISDHVSFPSLH